ncbi:MAG: hypothetical protein RSP_05790 [Rhodanobacter sp.]
MQARHWMVGCLIGLAGIGSAMATDFDARDAVVGSRATADSSAHDAGSNTGGDALGLNRDASSRHASDTDNGNSDNRAGSAAGGNEHGGGIPAPARTQPATLGWQSLLPGSIQ